MNRSMPEANVIPVLGYDDVRAAVAWLGEVLGFRERLRIGTHRAQLVLGAGAVVAAGRREARRAASEVLLQVADVDAIHARAAQRGARIVQPPTDFPYGERQCIVEDPGGHRWTLPQTIADVAPARWGGELIA